MYGYNQKFSRKISSKSSEHWVVGDTRSEDVVNNLKKLKLTDPAPEEWMIHYRKVKPNAFEKLKDCKLDHLLLIPEYDYKNCI
ncbi:MAG: hypothetical protein R3A13_04450 [Bdellovibrionota bacterium]